MDVLYQIFLSASASAVHVGHYEVGRCNHRGEVGQHQATAQGGNRLDMDEGRRADAGAVGTYAAVVHHVVHVETLGGFNRHRHFGGIHHRAPAHAEEVV